MSAKIGDMKSAHNLLAASCLLHMCGKYTLIGKVRHGLTSYVLQSHTLHVTIKLVYFSCKGILVNRMGLPEDIASYVMFTM